MAGGYKGTEAEWLASLKGADGKDGVDGKSAYEIAVDNGYIGSVQAWLASLAGAHGEKGDAGKSAFELAVDNGYIGSEEEWLASLVGKNGLSAYEIALKHGFEGTELEWLASLKGVGITASSVNANGELELTYSDGSVVNAGKIAGTDGLDGVGISNIQLAANGELTIYMTNGTNYAVGNVKGEKGDKGDRGEKGDTGAQGLPGANGRGIANMAFNASGELVVYYTDGTYQNLGAIPSNGDSGGSGGTDEPDEPEILSYSLLSDSTYGVSAGPDIASVTTVTIPSMHNGIAVTQILAEGFKDLVNLQQIILPEGLLEIKDNAFYGCYSLENVSLPSTLTSIGRYAFYDCSDITEVVIPSNVNYIGKYAYYGSGLTSATFVNASGWSITDSSSVFVNTSNNSIAVHPDTLNSYLKSNIAFSDSNFIINRVECRYNSGLISSTNVAINASAMIQNISFNLFYDGYSSSGMDPVGAAITAAYYKSDWVRS